MSLAFRYPYNLDPNNGVADTTGDPTKIYVDRVLTLLSTNIGQRPMLPEYGVDWSTAIFENEGSAQKAISQAIKTAVSKWIPEVTVGTVTFLDGSSSGIETINISLNLPNNTTTNLSVNSNTINYSGTIAG
jgi:phage baseplate assembly protein W